MAVFLTLRWTTCGWQNMDSRKDHQKHAVVDGVPGTAIRNVRVTPVPDPTAYNHGLRFHHLHLPGHIEAPLDQAMCK